MLDECSAIATARALRRGDRSSSDAFIDHGRFAVTASMFRDVRAGLRSRPTT